MAQVSNVQQHIIRSDGLIDEDQVQNVINTFNNGVNAFLATIPSNKVRDVQTRILLPFITQKLTLMCFITFET